MKKLLLIAIAFCTFTACDDEDNSKLWDEVNNQGSKIEMLEGEMEALKLKIDGLNQTFKAMTSMLNGGLITEVKPITEGDKTGYAITVQTASDSSNIQTEIYNIWNGTDGTDGNDGNDGNDGAPGSTPQIGVEKEETTGRYYWTLDGAPMLDDADGKIYTSSKAPQLKIDNDGSGNSVWKVSYDDGATWTDLGVFTGNVVSSSIKVELDATGNNVVIKQDGKTDITIPIVEANNLNINFTNIEAAAGVHVTKNGEYVVEYTLENASANATVKAELLNGTNFELENLTGENKFKVTAKGQLTSDVILVHVYDGKVCMHTSLNLSPDLKVLTITDPTPVVSLDNENVTYNGKLVLDQAAATDITLSVAPGSGTLSASNFSNLSSSVTIAQGQTEGTYSVTVSRSGLTEGQAYTLPITLTVSGSEVDYQDRTIMLTSSGERVDFQNNTVAMIAGQFKEIPLQESMLTSQYTGAGEGNLGNLCNNSEEDFWGSEYQSSCPPGDATYGVYIDINLSSTWRAVKFEYCTRHNNGNAVPQTIVIGGSNDGNSWTKCFTITEEGLPTATKTWWRDDPGHDLGASYSYIRFGVTKSKAGDLIEDAKKSTALTELKVYGLHE